jgi:Spy/CpxP family protein refolding chaperone
MKLTLSLLLLLIFLLPPAWAASDAVDSELFPAEFLYNHRKELQLTDPQIQALGDILKQTQPLFAEGKKQLDTAASALQQLLKQDEPDEKQADEKMHVLLDCEGDIKMLQLRTLLALRAVLTPPQLAAARRLRDDLTAKIAADKSQRERIEKKLAQLRDAIKAAYPTGATPAETLARAKHIYELLNSNDAPAAETEIDAFLTQLPPAPPSAESPQPAAPAK